MAICTFLNPLFLEEHSTLSCTLNSLLFHQIYALLQIADFTMFCYFLLCNYSYIASQFPMVWKSMIYIIKLFFCNKSQQNYEFVGELCVLFVFMPKTLIGNITNGLERICRWFG